MYKPVALLVFVNVCHNVDDVLRAVVDTMRKPVASPVFVNVCHDVDDVLRAVVDTMCKPVASPVFVNVLHDVDDVLTAMVGRVSQCHDLQVLHEPGQQLRPHRSIPVHLLRPLDVDL